MDHLSVEDAVILQEWGTVKAKLENLFRNRNQSETKSNMEKGIELFKQLLALTNDSVAESFTSFAELEYKPVNLDERLEFVITRPHLYHSFRQLSELMMEQEKLFVKKNIKKSSRIKS